MISRPCKLNVESDENAFLVGKVADDLLDRLRQPAHERWHGENLIACGELRGLRQVDDLDAVLPGEMGLADALEIGEGCQRFRGLAGDIEAQLEGGSGSRTAGSA